MARGFRRAAVGATSRLRRQLRCRSGLVIILAFDWYFLPPLRKLDAATVLVLGLFLVMAVIVGAFAARAGSRAAGSEEA